MFFASHSPVGTPVPFIHLVQGCVIRRNRLEKIKQVDKICCCVLLTSAYLKKILHCFFVVIAEPESVIIIDLKVSHFFCDVEKVQIGHSDAQSVYSFCPSARVSAQLVERQSAVREVEGSSPRTDQHSES